MRLLFFIIFLLVPGLSFSATPSFYTCEGNQPNSIVNIQFDASSPSENYVIFITSHDYRSVQYLYSTPIRFSMKSLTDSLGVAKFQVVGFYSSVSVSDIQCSSDDTNNLYWQLISFFIGSVAAMAFVMAATHRWW